MTCGGFTNFKQYIVRNDSQKMITKACLELQPGMSECIVGWAVWYEKISHGLDLVWLEPRQPRRQTSANAHQQRPPNIAIIRVLAWISTR